jgi:threonine dehydrogenase-like Zn-dependent dehydrogenase
MLMKAVAVLGKKDLRVVEVAKPSAGRDGAVVRMHASGICGSDLHVVNADLWTTALTQVVDGYRIIGHEFSGEIVETGPDVTQWKVGDRVTSVHNKGGMAEYVRIPAERLKDLYRVPPHVSYEIAATLEPLCTPMHAFNLRQPKDGDTVAIFGYGIIGLGYLQVVKSRTIARTIVVDVSPLRLDIARKLGADVALNARETDPVREIKALTEDRLMRYHPKSSGGCDIALEAAGRGGTLDQAMEVVKPIDGAVMVPAGYEDTVLFDVNQVVTNNIALCGCWGYSGDEPAEAFQLITSGQARRDLLVTHTFPLEQAAEAFRVQGDATRTVKVVLVHP